MKALLLIFLLVATPLMAQFEVGVYSSVNNLFHTGQEQIMSKFQKLDSDMCDCGPYKDNQTISSYSFGLQSKFEIFGYSIKANLGYNSDNFRFRFSGDKYPNVGQDGEVYTKVTEFQSNYTINSFRVELIDEIEMFKSFYLGYGLGTTINSVQNELLYKIMTPDDPISPVSFSPQPNVEYRDNGRTQVIYDIEGSDSEVRQVNAYAIITLGYNLDLWGIIINPYFQTNLLLNPMNARSNWRVHQIMGGLAIRVPIGI